MMPESPSPAATDAAPTLPAVEPGETTQNPPAGPEVEAHLAKVRAEVEELRDSWLRAKAEADNVRRRAQADVAAAHKYAIENFAESLVPVMDSLQAALATPQATLESLRAGVELTHKQLAQAFEKGGLVMVDPLGEKFDPHRHQAMATIESDQPANTVLQVYQKGFLVHDRVLRPALVVVAKGKEA
ncbi:Protein GrpE [Burkholderiales bacterium]|nr:Protein GrpE [Burkholderiales bacterium]